MKQILAVVILALSLSACATVGSGTTQPQVPPPAWVKSVQTGIVKACGYLPLASTVAAVAATFVPGATSAVALAETVINSICTAVTTNPLADGPGAKNYKPHVNGVRIKGQFVR